MSNVASPPDAPDLLPRMRRHLLIVMTPEEERERAVRAITYRAAETGKTLPQAGSPAYEAMLQVVAQQLREDDDEFQRLMQGDPEMRARHEAERRRESDVRAWQLGLEVSPDRLDGVLREAGILPPATVLPLRPAPDVEAPRVAPPVDAPEQIVDVVEAPRPKRRPGRREGAGPEPTPPNVLALCDRMRGVRAEPRQVLTTLARITPQRGRNRGRYSAGWAELAVQCGYIADLSEFTATSSARQKIKRNLRVLVERGFVTIISSGNRGSHAVYRIVL